MSLLLTFLITVLFPNLLHAQYSFTENNPVYQLDYHSQESLNRRYQYQSCSFSTSGWSDWIPRNCIKCGQSRYRYCLGAYNGCGNWYCLGNKLDYCQSPCPTIRTTDPRVSVNVARSHSNTCGARATFSCPDCYRPVGSLFTECLPNSTWSHDTPTCSAVTCSSPFQINNGYVRWGANCGDKAVYKCYYGYEILGEEELTCGVRGQWDPPSLPICIPVKCPHLTRPENGFMIMLTRSFRARAYFRCRMGYELHGPRSIRCSASGSWAPAPPACVRSNMSEFRG